MKNTHNPIAVLAAVASLGAGSMQAAVIYSEDFESTGITGTARTFGSTWGSTGWAGTSGAGTFPAFRANLLGSGLADPAIAGTIGNTFANVREVVEVSFFLPLAYLDNHTYTFSLDKLRQQTANGGQDPASADLLAVGATISFTNAAGDVFASQALSAHTPFDSVSTESLSFTTSGGPEVGQDIVIRIASTDPAVDGRFALDNIVLDETAVVPEPSAALLGGLGLLSLLRRRR